MVRKPQGIKSYGSSAVNYANRGKTLEMMIDYSNRAYQINGWADIRKAEPPVKVVKKVGNRIKDGWYAKEGFVDYFGISNGRALAFEAKSTKNRTSFPLSNIGDHQVEVLKRWQDQGAFSFLLIQFEKHQEVYLLLYKELEVWWEGAKVGERKSIPYNWFQLNCELVKPQRGIILDYLNALNLPG